MRKSQLVLIFIVILKKNIVMNWIKKNMLWIVVGFLVYKNWDKISPMLGMKKPETDDMAKAIEEGNEDDLA